MKKFFAAILLSVLLLTSCSGDDFNNLKNQYDNLESQIVNLQSEIDGLESALAENESEKEELLDAIEDLESAIAENESEKEELLDEIEDLESTIAENEKEKEELVDEIEDLESTIAENEKEKEELVGEIEGLESIVDENEQEKQDLMGEIADLKTEIEDQFMDLATEIGDLKESYNTLLSLIDTLVSNNAALFGQLQATIDELMVVKRGITDLLLQNYIEEAEFAPELLTLFLEIANPLKEEGKSFDEIVEAFYKLNSLSGVSAENDENSTVSTIRLEKPLSYDFDTLEYKVFYRDELLKTETLEPDDSFDITFAAPHYGKYQLKTKINYGNYVVEELHNFGVSTSEYSFATFNATLPVLLFTLDHVSKQPEVPTYIYLERVSTYKWDKLPENTYRFPSFIDVGSGDDKWYPMIDNLSKWTKELYDLNPASHFNYNVVDNHIGLAMLAFDRYEIPEANYTVNIWSDGIFTDTALNTYKTMDIVNTRVNDLVNFRASLKDISTENITFNTIRGNVEMHALAYSLSDNVNYYATSLSAANALPQEVSALMSEYIDIKTVPAMFELLRASGRMNEFEYLLGTRWGDNPEDGLSASFNSPKGKYLLILGTSTAGENPNATTKYYSFNDYMELVFDTYDSEYKIFYKGHPSYPSNAERKQMFAEMEIEELSNTIPVEIMMYIYPNVYVGGYRTTSFISSLQDQTLFFFGTKAHIEGQATLRDMIANTTIFDNTVYLYDENYGL